MGIQIKGAREHNLRDIDVALGQNLLNRNPQLAGHRLWLIFDLLRSLSRLDATGDWLSLEPRTPFQAYPRQERRY